MTKLTDPESCSWCGREVEDSDLIEQPDGARVCDECDEEAKIERAVPHGSSWFRAT